MSTVTLRDLYAAELHDLMNAERQFVAELPIMASRATAARLQRVLEDHHAETKIQIERLRLLLEQLNETPRVVPSGAVAALIEDARRRLDETERGETLDAALIAAAQRMEHWEMATYGTARSYAEALGDYDAVRMLQQTLDEEGHTDHVLTKLAERGINQAAGDDLLEESTRYRSRLRFLGAKDLPEAREHDIHLHNRAGEQTPIRGSSRSDRSRGERGCAADVAHAGGAGPLSRVQPERVHGDGRPGRAALRAAAASRLRAGFKAIRRPSCLREPAGLQHADLADDRRLDERFERLRGHPAARGLGCDDHRPAR